MDRVNGIGGSAGPSFGSLLRHTSSSDPFSSATPRGGRALVPVRPVDRSENSPVLSQRPAATFLTHLIATEQREPQTRDRRRAEPFQAVAAYAAALADQPGAIGRHLCRAM
jgi:hypothetical protein